MQQDPWSLLKAGRYQEAYELFTQEYQETGDALALANRGIALLFLGRYEEAVKNHRELVQIRGDSDSDYAYLGASLWLLGQRTEAIEWWVKGLDAPFADMAGGVELPGILLFGAYFTQDAALEGQMLRRLRKRWRRRKPGGVVGWPLGLAGLHLGELTPEQVDQAAAIDEPTLMAQNQCQADFHVGLYYLRHDQFDEALQRMQASVNSAYPFLEIEYHLARFAVEWLRTR